LTKESSISKANKGKYRLMPPAKVPGSFSSSLNTSSQSINRKAKLNQSKNSSLSYQKKPRPHSKE